MNLLLAIILIIFVLGYLLELILDILNLSHRKKPVPNMLADVYLPDRYKLQQGYEAESTKFSILQTTISTVFIIAIFYMGWLGALHKHIIIFELGNVLTTLIFFAVIAITLSITSLPFSIWSTFVIEEKYGFNKTTPWLFVADFFKSLLLTFTIGGIILALVTWVYYATGQWFWIIALTIILLFSLLANALYSTIVVPLFNKQKPLPDGPLLDSIKELSAKAKFPVSKVFVIDGSKRSTKANAYFSGFGKNRRVVLYDTLTEKMSNDEILAVLAHEIGHYRKHHMWVNYFQGAVHSALVLFVFGIASQSVELSIALGYEGATEPVFHLSLVAFGVLFSPIDDLIGVFTNLLSRKMEYQADAFAVKHGLGQQLVSGLKKLSAQNLSNLTPHPAFVFVNYSHPTLNQRIEAINIHKS